MNSIFTIFLLIIAFAISANGTSVDEKSLKELIPLASTIVGGKVVAVRMTDGKGREIANPAAMTGPGLANTIYFRCAHRADAGPANRKIFSRCSDLNPPMADVALHAR
jgi:hypothetical protein